MVLISVGGSGKLLKSQGDGRGAHIWRGKMSDLILDFRSKFLEQIVNLQLSVFTNKGLPGVTEKWNHVTGFFPVAFSDEGSHVSAFFL